MVRKITSNSPANNKFPENIALSHAQLGTIFILYIIIYTIPKVHIILALINSNRVFHIKLKKNLFKKNGLFCPRIHLPSLFFMGNHYFYYF